MKHFACLKGSYDRDEVTNYKYIYFFNYASNVMIMLTPLCKLLILLFTVYLVYLSVAQNMYSQ